MKKRNLVVALLPIFAGVVIAGTGFSAWYFETSTDTKKKTVGVEVSGIHDFSAGGFSYASPDKLTLDDPTYGNGLKFTGGTGDQDLHLKFKPQSIFGTTESGTYTFKLTATLPEAMNAYVVMNTAYTSVFTSTVGGISSTVSVSGTVATFTVSSIAFSDDTEQEFVLSLQNATAAVASTDTANLLHYTDAVIDTTTGKRKSDFTKTIYDTMKTAVSGQSVTFEVTELTLA